MINWNERKLPLEARQKLYKTYNGLVMAHLLSANAMNPHVRIGTRVYTTNALYRPSKLCTYTFVASLALLDTYEGTNFVKAIRSLQRNDIHGCLACYNRMRDWAKSRGVLRLC